MENLTEKEISLKYSNIEDKIPSVWPSWEKAGVNLAQDLIYIWDVRDCELYRVIALVSMRVPGLRITQHLDPKFAYMGLYPERMKSFDITPDAPINNNQP